MTPEDAVRARHAWPGGVETPPLRRLWLGVHDPAVRSQAPPYLATPGSFRGKSRNLEFGQADQFEIVIN